MMLSTTKKIENNIRTLTEGIIMAEKKSFVCYKDTLVHLELLTYEQRGKLFTAMLQHENNLEILKLDDQTAVAFSFIKLQLERDDEKWEQTSERRAQAGAKGGKASAESRRKKAQINDADKAFEQADSDVPQSEPADGECHAFGRYQRVKLSSADYEKLVSEFGSDKVDAAIEQVDMRAESTDNNKGWTRWEAVVRQYITNGWLPTDKKDTESKSVMDDIDFAN